MNKNLIFFLSFFFRKKKKKLTTEINLPEEVGNFTFFEVPKQKIERIFFQVFFLRKKKTEQLKGPTSLKSRGASFTIPWKASMRRVTPSIEMSSSHTTISTNSASTAFSSVPEGGRNTRMCFYLSKKVLLLLFSFHYKALLFV